MNDKELDEMIEWCRKKLTNEKNNPFGLKGKRQLAEFLRSLRS